MKPEPLTKEKIDEIIYDVRRVLRQPRKEQIHLIKSIVRKLEKLKEDVKAFEGVIE